jgi:hypothetical protein
MKKTVVVRLALIVWISASYSNSFAQQIETKFKNPPLNTEALFSNRGMSFQMIMNKQIQSVPKFGFFSITNLVGEWKNNRVEDHMTQAHVTYEIVKGLKLGVGFHLTPVTGIRPSAGLIYSKASENWLVVANARVDLSKDRNVDGVLLVEYKPRINEKWRFYSRLQGLYAHNTVKGTHSRSFAVARAGFNFKDFTFGAGTNIDYYGPMRHNENSFGGFISCLLF